MNLDLYRLLLKNDKQPIDIQPFSQTEEHGISSGKNILCIDYRARGRNMWYDNLIQQLPNNKYRFIYAKHHSISNKIILDIIKSSIEQEHYDIIYINFQRIMYREYLEKKGMGFVYKNCKAYSTFTDISCIYHCIFAFIKQITYIEMLTKKHNITFFWHCCSFQLYKILLFRFLQKQFFVGKCIPLHGTDNEQKKEQKETKLSRLFIKKTLQLR